MNVFWALLFILLPFLCMVYIGWHVWNVLPLPGMWKAIILSVGVACFLSLFISIFGLLDVLPLAPAKVMYAIGTSSLMVLLYMMMILLVLDLGRVIHLIPRAVFYDNWWSVGILCSLLFVIFIYGNVHYYDKVRVPLELKTSKSLKKDYKVVMATDLHLGYHNSRRDLAKWVDMINAEHPDFILIGGDIIDVSVRPLIEEGMADEFKRLDAPVYAVLGNHESYCGEAKAKKFYNDANIHLLVDQTVEIDSSIVIVGRDDLSKKKRMSINRLMSDVDSTKYIILADHQPYNLDEAEKAGVDFQLSGHTHRGQVWPISWITDAVYECSWGKWQRGKTQYYVSSGMGIWGAKFRIGTQSEYVVATISDNR